MYVVVQKPYVKMRRQVMRCNVTESEMKAHESSKERYAVYFQNPEFTELGADSVLHT